MKHSQSLKERLRAYMHRHHSEWVAKGFLCDLARQSDLKATGENTGRRLRELEESGELEVQYRTVNGTRHAFYRAASKENLLKEAAAKVAYFDSLPV
jgi:hypothetical protein